MAAIGFVNGTVEKGFVGELRTLSIRVPLEIRRNPSRDGVVQPDYRIYSDDVEIGAGWIRVGELSRKPYVSLTFAGPNSIRAAFTPISGARRVRITPTAMRSYGTPWTEPI